MSLIEHDNRRVGLKTARPLAELTPKHRAILSALVYGLDGRTAEQHGHEPGKALTQHETAAYFNVRRAYIRDLMDAPLFKAEFAAAFANKRMGYAPRAIDRIADAMESPDHNTVLKAAIAMLGETAKTPNVNVSVTNQTAFLAGNIKPGYVLKLPAETSAQTISQD